MPRVDKPRKGMTPKQAAVLRFLVQYRAQHGISPTLQEMATAMGISKVSIYERIDALAAKGYIVRNEGMLSRQYMPVGTCGVPLTEAAADLVRLIDAEYTGLWGVPEYERFREALAEVVGDTQQGDSDDEKEAQREGTGGGQGNGRSNVRGKTGGTGRRIAG